MSNFPEALARVMECRAAGGHKAILTEDGACLGCGEFGNGPTNTWECGACGETVMRFRGESDVSCDCGAQYNAGGQRLRDNWRNNPAWGDDDMDDMEGYEREMLGYEGGY